jgi:hypothetical protein
MLLGNAAFRAEPLRAISSYFFLASIASRTLFVNFITDAF